MHPILASRQRLLLHLLAWALVGALLGVLVHALLAVPWRPAVVFGLPLGLVAAPVSLSAWYFCRALPVSRTGPLRLAATAFVAAVVTASVWAALGRVWWDAVTGGEFDGDGGPVRALVALLVGVGALAYLLAVTTNYVVQAFEDSAAAGRRALESQVAQREAELRALRAQVDPHFLFNSLNSVAGLISADPDRARLMCHMLAEFLRDSLRLGAESRIDLAREVALAEQYLQVEQVRFGKRLGVSVDVAPEAAPVPVPPLVLQPLVENAVRHGIATMLDGGTVEVTARRTGSRAVIVVVNPRDPDERRRGSGFGLEIVRRRLEATFGDRAALLVEAAPASYRVSVTVPCEDAA
jgi:hypothetical protein